MAKDDLPRSGEPPRGALQQPRLRLESVRPGNDRCMDIDIAVRELREDLGEIAAIDSCASCECLLAIAAQALADLRRIPGDEARDAEGDIRRILGAGRDAAHPCIACDVCLPVEPYRRFTAAWAACRPEPGEGARAGGAAPDPPACAGCDCAGCD